MLPHTASASSCVAALVPLPSATRHWLATGYDAVRSTVTSLERENTPTASGVVPLGHVAVAVATWPAAAVTGGASTTVYTWGRRAQTTLTSNDPSLAVGLLTSTAHPVSVGKELLSARGLASPVWAPPPNGTVPA